MEWNNYISLIVLIVTLFLGFFVYLKDSKNRINQFFSLFVFSTAFWIFTNFMVDISDQENQVLLWGKLTLVGPILLAAFFLCFSLFFPKKKIEKINLYRFILIFIPGLLLLTFVPTRFNIEKVINIPPEGPPEVKAGILYYPFTLYLLFYMGLALYYLLKKYKFSSRIEKVQIKLVFVGVILSLFFAVVANIFLLLMGISEASSMGPLFSIILVAFTTYAIIEHHLFDIRVIATEALVALISLGLLIDVLLSKTLTEGGLKSILFLLVSYGGYRLVLSVREEIRRRQEIQKLTNQLKQANIRLVELDRLKSEFLSVASHELNSPMAVIKGYLHMILWEGFGKVDKNARQYLEKVYLKTDQLARLVADLLNVSRIEEGRIKLEIKPTEIEAVIKDICEDHALRAKEKGLKFHYYLPKKPLPKVLSDSDKLKEVLQNLLSNAIKFTKKGGVEVSVGQIDGMVQVNIKDTGVGIPKEAQQHIFEKFYRVDNSWVREVGGTGLGLYITREYIKLMGGNIWFESEGENKGTTFHFTLPIAKPGYVPPKEVKQLQFEDRPPYTKSPVSNIKENLEKLNGIKNNHNKKI